MPRRPLSVKLKPRIPAHLGELGTVATGAELSAERQTHVISRILPVVAHAVAVFGDEHKASHWLETPLSILGDRAPVEVLVKQDGVDAVERILTRIEHNIPS